jgi:Fe-S cluster biosynthesis and repair protein YggX
METNSRIEQWEKMTREAPDDMAWFSLGNAYKDAGRLEDAERSFGKALELNPGSSRAYQLRAQVLMQLERNEEADEVLTKGYTVAAERGDVMPQRAMGSLLQKLGKPLPEVQSAKPQAAQAASDIGGPTITDRRSGQIGRRLADPPLRGPIGKFIYDHYSQETWNEWIRTGTKVINELRLDFQNDNHQKIYDEHMLEWLGFTREEADEYSKQGSGTTQ